MFSSLFVLQCQLVVAFLPTLSLHDVNKKHAPARTTKKFHAVKLSVLVDIVLCRCDVSNGRRIGLSRISNALSPMFRLAPCTTTKESCAPTTVARLTSSLRVLLLFRVLTSLVLLALHDLLLGHDVDPSAHHCRASRFKGHGYTKFHLFQIQVQVDPSSHISSPAGRLPSHAGDANAPPFSQARCC